MPKTRMVYLCSSCGATQHKWLGQCPDCGEWNSISQEPQTLAAGPSRKVGYSGQINTLTTLNQIEPVKTERISSGYNEFDRVLGGGIVPGSAILIGGHPGAGKSTLLLQVVCHLARTSKALYVTGEESLQQIAMRAQRLGLSANNLHLMAETRIENIIATAIQHKTEILVVDSIQVMHSDEVPSAPGGVTQVRECASLLTRYAKQNQSALFLIGHVTKDGSLAGPKVLEHMIDSSIMFEGSDDSRYRTLRSHKNRFGAVNELGVFAMTGKGLVEVKNPSAIFLSRSELESSGSVVMVLWEGTRPLLVEIQALLDDTIGAPRRVAVGLDHNRLVLLLAVLHRHGGLAVGDQDVFLNVVGGVKVTETSADLAMLLAMTSSFRNRVLARDLVVFGEVGLSGEIRPVPNGQERLNEAMKHGFKQAIVPYANKPKGQFQSMRVYAVKTLAEALEVLNEVEQNQTGE